MAKKFIRPVKDIDAALRAYYGNGYISNKEVAKIFDAGKSLTWKLMKAVREHEAENGVPIVIPHHVTVSVAFEVWGINVKELERNRKKLAELNLKEED